MSGGPQSFQIPPYDMTHRSRGTVLIFNNKVYGGLDDRAFSDIDAVKIISSLASLGYDMKSMKQHMYKDFTVGQMMKVIRDGKNLIDNIINKSKGNNGDF